MLQKNTKYIFYIHRSSLFFFVKGLDLNWCKNDDTGLPQPDLVIYLDIPIRELEKREDYGNERYERSEFQNRVRESFKIFEKDENWACFDASQSILDISKQIETKVMDTMKQRKDHKLELLWSN